MNRPPEQYEWRSFAQDFGVVEQRLRSLGQLLKIRQSRDLYLLSPGVAKLNVKLRDQRLSIRQAMRCRMPLERWRLTHSQPLPLRPEQINRWVLRPLGLPPSLTGDQPLGTDQISQALLSETDLILVPVTKRRWIFTLKDCHCEVAEVSLNGYCLLSISLAATQPGNVLALARQLGLDAWSNRSYVTALRQLTGLESVPVEGDWCWE